MNLETKNATIDGIKEALSFLDRLFKHQMEDGQTDSAMETDRERITLEAALNILEDL